MLQQIKKLRFWFVTMTTGIFAGIFFSLMFIFLNFFHMVEVKPNQILELFFTNYFPFLLRFPTLTFIILVVLLSFILTILYALFFRKKVSWFIGALYGLAFWLIIYLIMPYLFTHFQTLKQLNVDSHVTSACLFVLYGTFIGYTVSFQYHSSTDAKEEEIR